MFPDPVITKTGSRDIAVEGSGSGFPIIVMNGAGSRHLVPPAVREGRDHDFRLIGYVPVVAAEMGRPGAPFHGVRPAVLRGCARPRK